MGKNIGTRINKNYRFRTYEVFDGIQININDQRAYKFNDDGKIEQWDPNREKWAEISNWHKLHGLQHLGDRIRQWIGWNDQH